MSWLMRLGGGLLMVCVVVLASPRAFAVGGTWGLTVSMHVARTGHTATLLANGNVVVAGGQHGGQATVSTEVYDPTGSTWTVSGDLHVGRARASAVLLPGGGVLVAGGCTGSCHQSLTATAEVSGLGGGKWSSTEAMATARSDFGMALLPDGRVLVAGGCTALDRNACTDVTASSEIYDPTSGAWSSTGSMQMARGALTVSVLQDGTVLAAGGFSRQGAAIGRAEIYDPALGTWSFTGDMNASRSSHTAVVLEDGTVLVAGGKNNAGMSSPRSELYDPLTGVWTSTGNLNAGRFSHTATLLGNGNVLIAGGKKATKKVRRILSNAEVYNPVTGLWLKTGKLTRARSEHTATILQSGQVLATGGKGRNKNLPSAEIYTP